MKIVFMGTPDFARESLEEIYNAGNEIIGVVTNPDKPKGRGMKMIASPVKEFAIEKNLKLYQPIKVRNNEEFLNEMKKLKPDLLCVVAYGKILPKEILDIPRYGSINVHGSLLPKYRGAAPIQWSVINGDETTGVTTMFMDVGMDTGDMIFKEETKIGDNETTGELWLRLSKIGARLLVKTVNEIENIQNSNKIENLEELKKYIGAQKQGDEFSIAPMLNKEMCKIDWNKSAQEIHNLVRGLNPIMGAYTFYDGKKLKIWKTEVVKEEKLANINILQKFINNDNNNNEIENDKIQNGTIILADKKYGIFVKTNKGILSFKEVQAENSKRMDIKSFLNGNCINSKIFE